MQQTQIRTDTFVRDESFDCAAYVHGQLMRAANWRIAVEFQTMVYTVQQKIPAAYGSLTETPSGVLLRCDTDDLDYMARYLMALGLPFVIHDPPELREALLRLAAQITQIATTQHGE